MSKPSMSFLQRMAGSMESIEGGLRTKSIKDGFIRYRSHAFAHMPPLG